VEFCKIGKTFNPYTERRKAEFSGKNGRFSGINRKIFNPLGQSMGIFFFMLVDQLISCLRVGQ